MEGSKPGVTRLSGQRALRVTVCRLWFPETCAVEHCDSLACVEKTRLRDMAFWRMLLT
jgi:hypothetical protein